MAVVMTLYFRGYLFSFNNYHFRGAIGTKYNYVIYYNFLLSSCIEQGVIYIIFIFTIIFYCKVIYIILASYIIFYFLYGIVFICWSIAYRTANFYIYQGGQILYHFIYALLA